MRADDEATEPAIAEPTDIVETGDANAPGAVPGIGGTAPSRLRMWFGWNSRAGLDPGCS